MSKIKYIQYNPNTGKIVSNGSCSERFLELQVVEGLTRLVGDGSYRTDYIDLNTLEIKPKTLFNLPLNKLVIDADGVDTITSDSVPISTELVFDNEKYIINDGSLEITLDVIGLYDLRLRYPQYLDEVITIEGI